MSVVTTKPEMVTSVTSTLNAPSPAAGFGDYPRDGAGMDGGGRVERRRNGGSDDSPTDILRRLPAVVVLERLPVPALAMARDGIILFVNTAFAEMVGYERDGLAGSAFPEVFQTVPAEVAAVSGVDAVTNLVVELRHCEGWTVRARMSNSAMMRRDDPVVLVTFDNLTERLWVDHH
jgi:PAS domain S-box-containing protein